MTIRYQRWSIKDEVLAWEATVAIGTLHECAHMGLWC